MLSAVLDWWHGWMVSVFDASQPPVDADAERAAALADVTRALAGMDVPTHVLREYAGVLRDAHAQSKRLVLGPDEAVCVMLYVPYPTRSAEIIPLDSRRRRAP